MLCGNTLWELIRHLGTGLSREFSKIVAAQGFEGHKIPSTILAGRKKHSSPIPSSLRDKLSCHRVIGACCSNAVLMKKVVRANTKKLTGIRGWQDNLRRSAAAPLAAMVQNGGGVAGEAGLGDGGRRGEGDAESFQVSKRDRKSVKSA